MPREGQFDPIPDESTYTLERIVDRADYFNITTSSIPSITTPKASKPKVYTIFTKCDNCSWQEAMNYTEKEYIEKNLDLNNNLLILNVASSCVHCFRNITHSITAIHRNITHSITAIHENSQRVIYPLPHMKCRRCSFFEPNFVPRMFRHESGEEKGYCRECYETVLQESLIHSHSWCPNRFKFSQSRKERSDYTILPFYGTELEINVKDNVTKHAESFKNWLKLNNMGDYFYFKKDGSISNGYEIVTHPITAKARNESINWHRICRYLLDSGASSEESGECGLHIHASINFFRQSELGKLKYFFWANRHELAKFSRRKNFRYCELEKYGVHSNKWNSLRSYNKSYPESGNRYTAVNTVTGKNTVEFRLMRGTLDHERLLAYFQFVDALIYFVKLHSHLSMDTPYSWSTFRLWAKETNRYWHMDRYLQKEGII